jgi:hypothetical protein
VKLRGLLFGLVLAAGGIGAAPVDMVGNAAAGAQADNLLAVVGDWLVQRDGAATVVVVDGSKWRQGTASANVAELAGAAFPQEAGTFAEAVKRHASFPLAIIKDIPTFTAGTVTVRFKALAGREDQAAGIAFAIQPNGDYLVLRANALENNLILFEFKNGRRSAVREVSGVPTKSERWHELTLVVDGNAVKGLVDGKQHLQHSMANPATGRIGLWSKADSVVEFSDLRVEATGR